MIIEYASSVLVRVGWRSVTITARVELKTAKTATVVDVLAIDGEEPTGYASRTGAKSQTYNASGIAKREIGKVKRLSSCNIILETT